MQMKLRTRVLSQVIAVELAGKFESLKVWLFEKKNFNVRQLVAEEKIKLQSLPKFCR